MMLEGDMSCVIAEISAHEDIKGSNLVSCKYK